MATVESIMAGARTHLRDQPRFFTAAVARAGLSQTFNLPFPNVRQFGLFFAGTDGTLSAVGVHEDPAITVDGDTFTYVVDEANGLVRIARPRTGGFGDGWQFNIEGYYYEWINETDMRYFVNKIVGEHAFRREGFELDGINDAEEDVMALGTAVECLYALLIEYSRDIDINTPEGIPVAASQRFRQVESLLFGAGGIGARYSSKASMLGVGLDRVEMLTLRRVSRTTNRLVPLYRPREWDDRSLPERVFPPIDSGGPSSPPPGFERSATVQGFYDGSGGGSAVPEP